jgi:hypothetical protein
MFHLYDTALRIAGALYPTSPGSDTQQHLGGPRARPAASLGVRPVRSRRANAAHRDRPWETLGRGHGFGHELTSNSGCGSPRRPK